PAAPPPPPPPPPPLPLGTQTHGVRKKRRVRSFYWKTIPEEKVRGKPNIWTMAVRQQQYQIDVRTVEELFGQQEESGAGRNPTASGAPRRGRSRASFKESMDEVSILDSKRGMNVGIFLKQFKKPNHVMVEDIRLGNSQPYGAEPLKELLKLLPESEEVKKLQSFKGDPEKLTLVDSFMYLLIEVPRFEVRIEAMVLKEEFFPLCAVMSREINVIRMATEELMNCEELHAILHLVLQAGNIMNAGGYAGNAVGFKLSSLLSLADTKANKPGMNLLHFVALEAQKKDEELLKFPEKLQHVQSAVRISVENIETEFSSLYVKTRSLEEKIQNEPELLLQLEPFLQNSTSTLQDLKRRRLDLRKEGNALIDFFCEDKDSFKLDECFRTFQDFCLKFKKAVKDNSDRELKEMARQRRLRELEERRFAWTANAAGAQSSSGGFGRSSSETDVDTLTKEGLLDFLLQSRPHSPHSPLGRSASARRYRHPGSADRNLRTYLELFSGTSPNVTDYAKFNSLPRSSRAHQRRTMAWLANQDDNRELEPHSHLLQERQVTSPETEPISPLARYSTDYSAKDHPYDNNHNQYTSLSEGGLPAHNINVFQKTSGQNLGRINVSVERHRLVAGPQPFDVSCPNKNNNQQMNNYKDILVTNLEEVVRNVPKSLVLDTPPSSKSSDDAPKPEAGWQSKTSFLQPEEEDDSTVSSTTCDTPLPLDPSMSGNKAVYHGLDCTETDCSVMLDFSELETSPIIREGMGFDPRSPGNFRFPRDPSSLSSNLESTSTNDQSMSTEDPPAPRLCSPASASQSGTTDEPDPDSVDTDEGRKVDEKAVQTCSPKPAHKTKASSKGSATQTLGLGRSPRTLTPSEHQTMRKVVPLTKVSRSFGGIRKAERPSGHEGSELRRPLRDQSTPARRAVERNPRAARHSSLPPEDCGGGSTPSGSLTRWARDPTPRRSAFRKPTAKPLRNVPKPAPEEKICRSAMRALAQAQAQSQAASEASSSQTLPSGSKGSIPLPSFARNTISSVSRTKKEASAPSSPATPVRSATLGRTGSQKVGGSVKSEAQGGASGFQAEENAQGGSLRRVQSVRASSRSTQRSDTPPPPVRERSRKSSNFSEKSFQTSISTKTLKPSWK
ncbi:FH2 domain-containing protein 1, partial [Alosa alosa]